jgi:hypothetical protein
MAALDAPVRSARSPRGEEAADLMKIAADLMQIAILQLGVSFKYHRAGVEGIHTTRICFQVEYCSDTEYVQAFIYPLKALT